jgi:hypothetical protein
VVSFTNYEHDALLSLPRRFAVWEERDNMDHKRGIAKDLENKEGYGSWCFTQRASHSAIYGVHTFFFRFAADDGFRMTHFHWIRNWIRIFLSTRVIHARLWAMHSGWSSPLQRFFWHAIYSCSLAIIFPVRISFSLSCIGRRL